MGDVPSDPCAGVASYAEPFGGVHRRRPLGHDQAHRVRMTGARPAGHRRRARIENSDTRHSPRARGGTPMLPLPERRLRRQVGW